MNLRQVDFLCTGIKIPSLAAGTGPRGMEGEHMINLRSFRLLYPVVLITFLLITGRVQADIFRTFCSNHKEYVAVEILDKDLLHIRYGTGSGNPGIAVSPMIYKRDYSGTDVETIVNTESVARYRTSEFDISIDKNDLGIVVRKIPSNEILATFNATGVGGISKVLKVSMFNDEHFYGLGEKVRGAYDNSIDWRGRKREFGPFGNIMEPGLGGANANMSVPVLFSTRGYALFLDNVYRHTWNFQGKSQWTVKVDDGPLRFYVMTGPNLVDLVDDYTELTGRAPIPPKTMLGLYMSEYGYDNWKELNAVRSGLQTAFDNDPANDQENFPLDGFILDLQWFGGVPAVPGISHSSMGRLTWDDTRFQDARAHIKELKEKYGLNVVVIEEAYVDKNLPEYHDLVDKNFLVKAPDGSPCFIGYNPWWGTGGMIDFTNPRAGAYWFDQKHVLLIEDGVEAFWTDLGEPEMYRPECIYYGGKRHKDIHNIFNLLWSRSIYEGYRRHFPGRRHFILSRSGTAGSQRYGVGFWSGDIGANEQALVAQVGTMINLGLSGMPYWGTDISGFHGVVSDPLYTRWFQFGAFTSIFRPHKENLCNCKPDSPAIRGNKASNLYYTRLRYALSPYIYAAARQAYETGLPIMRGLVLHYENDPNVYNDGSEFLLGRDLLVAPILRKNRTYRNVYLPKGDNWYDFYRNIKFKGGTQLKNTGGFFQAGPSPGKATNTYSTDYTGIPGGSAYFQGVFRKLPLYVRAGAIISMVYTDEKTMNFSGRRSDGTKTSPLIFRIYPDYPRGTGHWVLYEDDGVTTAYKTGEYRKTPVTSRLKNGRIDITISATQGTYKGAKDHKIVRLEIITGKRPDSVYVESTRLDHTQDNAMPQETAGWFYRQDRCLLCIDLGDISTTKEHTIRVDGVGPSDIPIGIRINYYGTGWHQVFIHYGVRNQAGPWKTVPMTTELIGGCLPGWQIDLPVAISPGIDFVFTNGTNWDNNGKQDYHVENTGQIWVNAASHDISATPPPCRSTVPVHFRCYNAWTAWGQNVYIVGNTQQLGNWDTRKAIKLDPVTDPWQGIWEGELEIRPASQIEWKCIIKDPLRWQPGSNNQVTTPATGTTIPIYTNGRF